MQIGIQPFSTFLSCTHRDDIGQHSYRSTEFFGRSKDRGASSEIVYEMRKSAKNLQMVLKLNLSENASLIVYVFFLPYPSFFCTV